MNKPLGSALAGLLVLQGALPSLGMTQPWSNITAVSVAVSIAVITYWLKPSA